MRVAPLKIIVTPVATQRIARETIVIPAAFAFLLRMDASIRGACVTAKTKKPSAMRLPRTRCRRSIAMKNDEIFVNATR